MTTSNEDSLSATQLAYYFSTAAGFELIGSEDGFALYLWDEGIEKRVVLFGDAQASSAMCFEDAVAHKALELALGLNANFRVVDGMVYCDATGFTTAGATYTEAAMKAVVVDFGRKLNSKASPEVYRAARMLVTGC